MVAHASASDARIGVYYLVRYATPLLVLLALAAGNPGEIDLRILTGALTLQVVGSALAHVTVLKLPHLLPTLVAVGMAADVAVITVLVDRTGGASSPLVALFAVYALAAGILLSTRAGMRMLALATAAIVIQDLARTRNPEELVVALGTLWIVGGAGTLFGAANEKVLRRQAAELAAIRRVTLDIEDSLSLKEICADLCRGVVEGFGFTAAAVLQRDGDELACVGAFGATGRSDARVELRGRLERLLSDGHPAVVTREDARKDGGLLDLIGPRGYVAIPIEDALLVATRTGRGDRAARLHQTEVETLERLSHHARLAIANARLHDRVSEMARTDPLTDLFNHGEMQRQLENELAKIARYRAFQGAGHFPSVLLVDIDHFKSVNDRHGHQVGDVILRAVADKLRGAVRSFDIVARYGGEEFAVILPGTAAEDARAVAERVRRAVCAEPLWVSPDGKKLKVTASIGVATSPDNGTTAAGLFQAADVALYRSKDNGRNRTTHAADVDVAVAKVFAMDSTRRRRAAGEDRVAAGAKRARARSSPPKRRTPRG